MEPSDAKVSFELENGVALITLDAPKRRNALVPEVRDGLIAALDRCEADPEVRAMVLTGAGGAFCAGGDISYPADKLDAMGVRSRMRYQHEIINRLIHHPKPLIAAVDGPAFGAGFSLALACDFVVAGKDASFCSAFGRIGVMPDLALLWSLTTRISIGAAREVVMFADTIRSPRAKELGFIDYLVPDGPALGLAMERATVLAKAPTASISVVKAVLARAPLDLPTVLAAEIEGQAVLSATRDQKEGIRAFQEKRKPRFEGR